jgi:hypothetical protein
MHVPAVGRRVAITAGLAIVLLASLLLVSIEVWHVTGRSEVAESRIVVTPDPNSSAPLSTDVPAKPIPLYDTAWLAPLFSVSGELDEYFAHLRDAGFTGAIMMLTAESSTFPERISTTTGKATDYIDSGGMIRIEPGHVAYLRVLLDKAQTYGLKIGFAAMWEQDAVCGANAKKPAILKTGNAHEFGAEVARAVGSHPAVGFWLFGGDAETGPDGKSCYADVNIWRQMAKGLKDNGANQPIGYHTARGANAPGLQQRHIKWATESWLDILMPQTGQCYSAEIARSQLEAVKAYARTINKPVYSIEMRYESTKQLAPSFCANNGVRPKVTVDELRADARVAADVHVDGLVYGHHDRWEWGNVLDESVAAGGGFDAVRRSFGSPGEAAYLAAIGR